MSRAMAIGLVSALLPLSTASAALITFDDVLPGPIEESYLDEGVVFHTVQYDSTANLITPVAGQVVAKADPVLAISGANVMVADPAAGSSGQPTVLLDFFMPGTTDRALVDHVGISLDNLADLDPRDDSVLLFAIGLDGRILGVDSAFDSETRTLSITLPDPLIARAVIRFAPAPRSADTEAFDNLSIGTAVHAPEPGTALLLLGGMMLGLRRRR